MYISEAFLEKHLKKCVNREIFCLFKNQLDIKYLLNKGKLNSQCGCKKKKKYVK